MAFQKVKDMCSQTSAACGRAYDAMPQAKTVGISLTTASAVSAAVAFAFLSVAASGSPAASMCDNLLIAAGAMGAAGGAAGLIVYIRGLKKQLEDKAAAEKAEAVDKPAGEAQGPAPANEADGDE